MVARVEVKIIKKHKKIKCIIKQVNDLLLILINHYIAKDVGLL